MNHHRFVVSFILFAAAALPASNHRIVAADFAVQQKPDRVLITDAGQPVATYVFRDDKILRPYFANVHAPGGIQVTRNHPPVPNVDATDHDTMHPGVWLAFGDLSGLPSELAAEANARLKALVPKRTPRVTLRKLASPAAIHETEHFRVTFNPRTGAIGSLEHRQSGRQWAGPEQPLGLCSYQTFSQPEFDRFMSQYVVEGLRTTGWAVNSWTKLGLEKSGARSGLHFTVLKQLFHEKRPDGHFFLADLDVPGAGDSGCPREITVETFLPDDEPVVKMVLKWFNKPAARLPEALWFSFTPRVAPDGELLMDKMGQAISPLGVVKNGNRNFHGLIGGLSYKDDKSGFQLDTLDAFLVAPGRRPLLIFDNQQPDIAGGLHFCLFNNLTGTNFTMWFEDDMQFRFVLKFGDGFAGPRSRQAAEEGQ